MPRGLLPLLLYLRQPDCSGAYDCSGLACPPFWLSEAIGKRLAFPNDSTLVITVISIYVIIDLLMILRAFKYGGVWRSKEVCEKRADIFHKMWLCLTCDKVNIIRYILKVRKLKVRKVV